MKLLWIIMACYTLKTTISTGSVNSTGTDVADNVALGQDVFRQLLNQETLIRINLVKHVHTLMQEMVTLKDNTLKLQNSLDEILIGSKEDLKSTQRDIKALKLENQKLKETSTEMETVLKEQNETDIKINNAISNLHKDQQKFERQMNGNLDSLERNVTGALSGINVNMRLLSMAVVNVDKRSNDLSKRLGDVNQSIPELIEEKGRMVSEIVRNMSEHLSEETNNTLENMKSELADTQQNQLKMAAAVLSLEWFKNNMSKGNCDISKRVGFTAGVSSSNTLWSSGKLVFNKVLHNKGAGYDSSSGVFTAPSAGVYVFYVSITSYSDNEINVDITLNGYSQVTARAKGGSGRMNYSYSYSYSYQTGTNMATLSLKRGDRVWIQYTSGTGYSSKSVPTTTFSGFLI